MKSILTILTIAIASSLIAQTTTICIKPFQTDSNYLTVQDSHLVVRNTITHRNSLFLFIGGTGSNTQQYQTISNFAASLGYDVINLAYPNDVAAASLANSSDSLVFNTYRQEVCFGTSLSSYVSVDTLNSIYTRTLRLIQYLAKTYPTQNWNQYLLNSTALDWTKIAVGGHSQGGGHAAYLAKFNTLDRVLMFSSPNDYSNHFSNAANWLRIPGITPTNRHFAYLHLQDEVVDFNKQLANIQGLGLYPYYDTIDVDNISQPYSNSHCLYTKQSPGLAILYHNTTTKFSSINNAVWTYMLSSMPSSNIELNSVQSVFSVYPNPVNACLNIRSDDDQMSKTLKIFDLYGQIVYEEKIQVGNGIVVDVSQLQCGCYCVSIDNKMLQFFKQ